MEIVWDEPKRQANLVKHGFDFADFDAGFSWDRYTAIAARPSRTGRVRLRFIGTMAADLMVAVVSPLGTEALSIISLRRASAEERRFYEEQA